MKLFVLLLFWFPATVMILFLSVTTLLKFDSYKKFQTLGISDRTINLFNFYDTNNFNQNEFKLPDTDARVTVLKKFFATYRSPLIDVAEEIVYQSDLYGIDYALIPAIGMQESQGCKVIPPGSYNCWGFGIYGQKKIYFNSYEQAISAVAKTIKEAYIKRGLTNPTLLEDRWTPSSVGNWSYSVNFFIGKIRELEKNNLNS
ncbi:hypothetical protein A2W14_06150 [Candidatus Gottesmanbacteria bacterium RBG_16_37_8]|uniref:Mannosyl-glycoprotein endo-beta-N-acetylglucosamidase-like domain-containing protein n=1 Tax=Candidatus Gottesmanbacteria bacterium RBG_16_37_8 TaxID=1798371 RepID=A0A1F5YR02_9BACT|nr:MAG: hypothetical protein A2W14_06150 [Candidatus Gottesmanbacteria bacterium RBG_16_37_8]